MRADRARLRDRSPRPERGAPPGGRTRAPPGRPPSAPGGDGTAHGHRDRSALRIAPVSAASAPSPSWPAARHSKVTSPTGSAAAVSSSRRVSAGSDSSLRWKLCSIRFARGVTSSSPNPPASSAGLNPRGNSSRASGLPRDSATTRSRTCSSSASRERRVQQRAGVIVTEPSDHELRKPCQLAHAARLAHREHQADRFRQEAARYERE